VSNKNKAHIILYRDEFKEHIWENYCYIAGLDPDCDAIKLAIIRNKCEEL